MLGKLLKYDLKWCFKPLLIFYILAIFVTILIRIVESFEQTLILLIIDKILCGIGISMLINILINCFFRNWARFIRNIYKDESYLTHTLPVSKDKIYLSKVLTIIITLATSFIVILASLAIGALNESTWEALKAYLEETANFFNVSVSTIIITMLMAFFLEMLYMIMSGILGIIIGHKSNNLKVIKSIVAGFVIYMALSSISLLVLYVAGFLNPDVMSAFNTMEIRIDGVKSIMAIGIILYVIYNVAIYFTGYKLLKKGVNVD